MLKSNSTAFTLLTIIIIFCSCKKETTTKTENIDGDNFSIDVNGTDTTILANNLVIYNTGNSSELVNSIMIAKTPSWDTGEVIFSIQIPELKKGDIIVARGETQGNMPASLSGNDNVAFTGYLILTDSPEKKGNATPKYEITEDNGFNIMPDMGHGVMVKFGTYFCQNDLTNMYVNFCCKAYSNSHNVNPPNDFLTIAQDYGRLSVTVYRNR